MTQDGKQKLITLLFGFAFSLLAGLIFSSLYLMLKHGRGSSALTELDIFAFWYETPFYLGHFTGDFYTSLFIVGVTAFSAVIALAVSLFKTKHLSTTRRAGIQKLRGNGHSKAYRKVSALLFGKTTEPLSFGQHLIKRKPPLHMNKVKFYSDLELKCNFGGQKGDLPEPRPVQPVEEAGYENADADTDEQTPDYSDDCGFEADSGLEAKPGAEESVVGRPRSLSDGTCNSTEERHRQALELEKIQQEKARQNKVEAKDHPPAADHTPVQGEAPVQGRREIPTEPRQNATALKMRKVLLERIKSVDERNRLMSKKNRYGISS